MFTYCLFCVFLQHFNAVFSLNKIAIIYSAYRVAFRATINVNKQFFLLKFSIIKGEIQWTMSMIMSC